MAPKQKLPPVFRIDRTSSSKNNFANLYYNENKRSAQEKFAPRKRTGTQQFHKLEQESVDVVPV